MALEYLSGGTWTPIPGVQMNPTVPADNTTTKATFPTVTAEQVRVNFTTTAALNPLTGYTTGQISVNEIEVYEVFENRRGRRGHNRH